MICSYSREQVLRAGFSLVELLVVIGLLGVLVGLIMPAVQQVRDASNRAKCLNNLRQVGIGLHHHHDVHGRMPPRHRPKYPSNEVDTLLSWMALILPEMEEVSLWRMSERACRIDQRPWQNPPHVGYVTPVATYACPSDSRLRAPLSDGSGRAAAFSSYIGVAGWAHPPGLPGVLGSAPGIRLAEISDGTSHTLMVGERPPPDSLQAGGWYAGISRRLPGWIPGPDRSMQVESPIDAEDVECARARTRFGPGRLNNPCDRYHFWSLHRSGANFLFADGSAQFLTYSASGVLGPLATRSGGEVVNWSH